MRSKKTSWYFKIMLNITLIIIWIIPLSLTSVYKGEEGIEELEYNFIHNDNTILGAMILFCLIWIIFQYSKIKWIRNSTRILLVLFSGFIMLYGIGGLILPIQDFYPYIGLYIMLTILPMLVLIFLIEYREKKNYNKHSYSNILDEQELQRLKK